MTARIGKILCTVGLRLVERASSHALRAVTNDACCWLLTLDRESVCRYVPRLLSDNLSDVDSLRSTSLGSALGSDCDAGVGVVTIDVDSFDDGVPKPSPPSSPMKNMRSRPSSTEVFETFDSMVWTLAPGISFIEVSNIHVKITLA